METIATDLNSILKKTSKTSTKICNKHPDIVLGSVGWGDFVRFEECEKCKEEARIISRNKTIDSGNFAMIPLRFKSAMLSQFQNMEQYTDFDSLFIYGVCGTGKTHLAVALLKEYCRKNDYVKSPRFFNFQDIAIEVKSSFASDSLRSMDKIIDECKEAGVAIFDDICTAKVTPSEIDALYLIVNYRYENYLPSIYTTNLSLLEIAKSYGDRISSRLSSGKRIKLSGADRRANEAPRPSNLPKRVTKKPIVAEMFDNPEEGEE